jgi:hypothetical protein
MQIRGFGVPAMGSLLSRGLDERIEMPRLLCKGDAALRC